MLKQLTKNKDYLFIAGVVLLMVVGYQFAFKNTITAWQVNRQLEEQLTLSADLSYQPDYEKRKNANLDSIIHRFHTDTLSFRNTSLTRIAAIAEKHGVRLSEVPVQDLSSNNEIIMVQKLSFDGDFFALTKMLNDLQQAYDIGMIRSVNYRLAKNQAAKLSADLYFEIIK